MTAKVAIVIKDSASATRRLLTRIQACRQTTLLSARGPQIRFAVIEVTLAAISTRKSPTRTVSSWLESDHCCTGFRNRARTIRAEMSAQVVTVQCDAPTLGRLLTQLGAYIQIRNVAGRIF